MLTTVKGTYHDGLVELDEPAPATGQSTRPVLVTFLEPEAAPSSAVAQHRFSWQSLPAETEQTENAISVANEVIAERQERD